MPAIAVPTWVGPPFRNARTWSRRDSGTTLTRVSHAGEHTPCSQTDTPNRTATIVANEVLTSSAPNDPAYRIGSTRIIAVAPNQPMSRFVRNNEATNANAVTIAENTPRNPASWSVSANRDVADCANGRYSRKNRMEKHTDAAVIHASSGERRTNVKPCNMSRIGAPRRRGARRGRRAAAPPSTVADRSAPDPEAPGPHEQEVLHADRRGQRSRREAADHGAEDRPGAEQREQPLRAPGVGDQTRRAPQRDRLHEHRDGDREPQDGEDPRRFGQQDHALHRDDRTGEQQQRHVRAAAVHPREQRGEGEHRREPDDPLHQVDARERVGADALEEQRAHAALADRVAGGGDDHRRDEQAGVPPLARLDPERASEEVHAGWGSRTRTSRGCPFSETCRRSDPRLRGPRPRPRS